jgi:hypothetical protein
MCGVRGASRKICPFTFNKWLISAIQGECRMVEDIKSYALHIWRVGAVTVFTYTDNNIT